MPNAALFEVPTRLAVSICVVTSALFTAREALQVQNEFTRDQPRAGFLTFIANPLWGAYAYGRSGVTVQCDGSGAKAEPGFVVALGRCRRTLLTLPGEHLTGHCRPEPLQLDARLAVRP
jgi:hypothetical protein